MPAFRRSSISRDTSPDPWDGRAVASRINLGDWYEAADLKVLPASVLDRCTSAFAELLKLLGIFASSAAIAAISRLSVLL